MDGDSPSPRFEESRTLSFSEIPSQSEHGAGDTRRRERGAPLEEFDMNPPDAEILVSFSAFPETTMQFRLQQFLAVEQLREAVVARARELHNAALAGFADDTQSRIRLVDSCVVFNDSMPAYLLAVRLLSPVPADAAAAAAAPDRVIRVLLEPADSPAPFKAAFLKKMHIGTALLARLRRPHWESVHCVLSGGVLSYGKHQKDTHQKQIVLAQCEIFRGAEPATFDIVSPNRDFQFMAKDDSEAWDWMQDLRLSVMMHAERPSMANLRKQTVLSHCALCKRPFSFFKKRFTCVQCGCVFCDDDFVKDSRMCVPHHTAAEQEARDLAFSAVSSDVKSRVCSSSGAQQQHSSQHLQPSTHLRPVIRRVETTGLSSDPPRELSDRKLGEGVLQIDVLQAHDLMAADSNGKSDPYVTIYFEGGVYSTSIVQENLNPVWKQKFVIRTRGEGHLVHIGVFDHDLVGRDDFLGMVSLNLHRLSTDGSVVDSWFPVQPRPGALGKFDKGVKGELHLKIRFWNSVLNLLEPVKTRAALDARLDDNPDADGDGGAAPATAGQSGANTNAGGGSGGTSGSSSSHSASNNNSAAFNGANGSGGSSNSSGPSVPSLSRRTLASHFKRAGDLWDALQTSRWTEAVNEILEWRSPARTLACFALYLYACFYMPAVLLFLLPVLLLVFLLLANFVNYRFFGKVDDSLGTPLPPCAVLRAADSELRAAQFYSPAVAHRDLSAKDSALLGGDSAGAHAHDGGSGAHHRDSDDEKDLHDDDDEHGDVLGGGSKKRRGGRRRAGSGDSSDSDEDVGVVEKLQRVKRGLQNFQNAVGSVVATCERMQSIMTWKDPVQSAFFLQMLLALTVVVALVPTRILFALAGIHRFTKYLVKIYKGRKKGVPDLKRFLRRDSGNLLINFVNRAPLPTELEPTVDNLPEDLRIDKPRGFYRSSN